jgi:DNA modification methylase
MKRKLMFGDCLERMKEIPDKSVDMVLTDPPYGTTACKWDTVIDFKLMWTQLKRITKDNGAICLFGNEPFSSALRMSNIKMFKYDWIWNKKLASNIFQAKYQPLRIYEIVSVFCKSKTIYYPQKTDLHKIRKYKDKYGGGEAFNKKGTGEVIHKTSGKFPVSILEHSNAVQKGKVHPTQKPVSLLEYLIKTYTLESETVLDFTMGSGSTGVACKNLKRNFIGIEKDKEYFRIAKQRIENA